MRQIAKHFSDRVKPPSSQKPGSAQSRSPQNLSPPREPQTLLFGSISSHSPFPPLLSQADERWFGLRISKVGPDWGGDISPLESCQVDSKGTNFIFNTSSLPFTEATFVARFSGRSLRGKVGREAGRGCGAGGAGSSRGLSTSVTLLFTW